MFGGLINILAPPLTSAYGTGRMKIYVRVILGLIAVSFGLVFLLNDDVPSKISSVVMLAYTFGCLGFFVKGNMTIPRVSIPLILYVILSMLIWRGLGLHSVTVPALTLVIAFSALLSGRWASFIYMVLSMATLAGVLFAEQQGWVENGQPQPSTTVELLNLYLTIVALTIALMALMRHMEVDRDNARSSESDARRLNDELKVQSNTLVEQQTALAISESQYRLLSENVHDFIWTADLNFAYTFCSPSSERILGYTPDELIGKSALETVPPEWLPRMAEALSEELQLEEEGADKERYRTFEMQLIRKDGSLLWIEVNASLLRDKYDVAMGIVGTTRDISERIHAEEEKNRLEEQSRQSQKIEAIGRLSGGVAHDLNNLLTPILGYAELMRDGLEPKDPRREYNDQILFAAEGAQELVGQLLALGRNQTLEYKPIDLNETIQRFEKLVRRTLRDDIEFTIIQDPTILPIRADIRQIEQVILNLIVNAQDAMADGGQLTLETSMMEIGDSNSTFSELEPGSYIVMTIHDTGIGMDEETKARIFDPFFSTKGDDGIGLGLATVYGIIKQHDGDIRVHSEQNAGTTFTICLPATEYASQEDTSNDAPLSTLTGSETILLVEDNGQVRDLARTCLEDQGYTVLPAACGIEAIHHLESHTGHVDLLFTDVVMPEMNGKELHDEVIKSYPKLKVLYMSGYAADVIGRRGVLEEGIAFIQKPFSVQDLKTKIREVLDHV
jgi:PAS domain S-box-containing protein